MGADTEVVEVAVELCGMTCTTDILVHGRELEVGLRDEVVHAGGRHVQETVLAAAVTVVEVIAQTELYLGVYEVTHLGITAPVVVRVIDLLALGEADMHIVGLCADIPAVFQHRKLKTSTEIVGRFTFCLVVEVGTQSEEHLVLMEQFGVTLCHGHGTLGLVRNTSCIEQ